MADFPSSCRFTDSPDFVSLGPQLVTIASDPTLDFSLEGIGLFGSGLQPKELNAKARVPSTNSERTVAIFMDSFLLSKC
jgi:hypothetical protein